MQPGQSGQPGEITRLLRRIEQGDADAHNELARLVRAQLKRIAANRLRRERPDHLYRTSDLVQEAYARIFRMKNIQWEGHEHFFKVAALQMRRILVEYARREYLRGNGGQVPLEDVPGLSCASPSELLRVNELIEALLRIDRRRADILILRYFGGYSIEEVAQITKISPATVKRQWTVARDFIKHQYGFRFGDTA